MNCAECKAEVPAGEEWLVFKAEASARGPALLAIVACLWRGPTEPRVVARGLCRKCAEAVACDGSACTRCNGLIRGASERWMLVAATVAAAHIPRAVSSGRHPDDAIEYVACRRDRDDVASTLERGLCYFCATQTKVTGEWANDLSGKLPPAALTVPFQRTAEASP